MNILNFILLHIFLLTITLNDGCRATINEIGIGNSGEKGNQIEYDGGQENMEKVGFRILTLNCWGLPALFGFGSKDKDVRIDKIIEKLLDGEQYDVVTLQEIWVQNDYKKIAKLVKQIYPFSIYFNKSGGIGSGVVVFSRHQIEFHTFKKFTLNGNLSDIYTGECLTGKMVGFVQIQMNQFKIGIFTTHTIADYSTPSKPKDQYFSDRLAQCLEIVEFVREIQSAKNLDLTILAGDFNLKPNSLGYQFIEEIGKFINVNKGHFPTYGGTENKYSSKYEEMEIDHIFYQNGNNAIVLKTGCQIDFQKFEIIGKRGKKRDLNYSDHFGLSARFILAKNNSEENKIIENTPSQNSNRPMENEEKEKCINILTETKKFLKKSTNNRIPKIVEKVEKMVVDLEEQ